ncbi:hypothetical protein ACH5RR_002677 [Cinchona calisaya]|uniref:Uncharacterized protein n=1 Tax=Cinchona calisaya TaxID=153742 RepID=A0ABD3AT13_9GENT
MWITSSIDSSHVGALQSTKDAKDLWKVINWRFRGKGNLLRIYNEVIGIVEKEITARKLNDAPKAERVAFVEENGSIAHANTSTQVGNNIKDKRHDQSAKNLAKLVILTNSVEIVNILASKGIQKKIVGNYSLTSSLRISQAG